MTRSLLPFSVILALLGFTAVAEAGVYRGNTNQGKRVVLLTDKQGELTRITFRSWKSGCTRDGVSFHETTSFIPPLKRSNPGSFSDRGDYRLHQVDGEFDIRVRSFVRGEQVSDRRWKGIFRPTAVVRQDGHFFARCEPGRISWGANLPGAPAGANRQPPLETQGNGAHRPPVRGYVRESPSRAAHLAGAAPDRDAYIAEVDPMCKAADRKVRNAIRGYGEALRKDRFQRAARILADGLRIYARSVDEVARVEPPAKDADRIERWLGFERRDVAVTRRMVGALRHERLARFNRLVRKSRALERKIERTIGSYGFQDCN